MPITTYRATVKNRKNTQVLHTEDFQYSVLDSEDPASQSILKEATGEYRRQFHIRVTYDLVLWARVFGKGPLNFELAII